MSKKRVLFASLSTLAVAAAILPATAAMAQAAGPGQVEEVIVTAQRRSENLQSVPLAVSAYNAETLARAGVSGTADLQMMAPSLVYTTALSIPIPYIRGVGTRDNSAANESNVSTYVDGVYVPALPGGLLALSDIERVEVLRGPQGTLFGRNATGGLIQIVTRKPSQEPGGNVKIGYSSYQTVEASGYFTGGLTDHIAANLSVYFTDQSKGWGRNLINGHEVNLTRDFAARSKIAFDYDTTHILLSVDYDNRQSDVGLALNIVGASTSRDGLCGVGPPPALAAACPRQPASVRRGSIYDSLTNLYGRSGKNGASLARTEQSGASLIIEHDAGFAELRSLTSARKTRNQLYADSVLGGLPITQAFFHQDDRSATQELQLISTEDSPVKWIVGGFYMNRIAGYDPFNIVGYVLGLPTPTNPTGTPPFFGVQNVTSTSKVNTLAGYGQATVPVTSKAKVTVGLRYTTETQDFASRSVTGRGLLIGSARNSVDYAKWTYRVALDYSFTDSILGYVSQNRGFKAGVFNLTGIVATPAGPEVLDATEIGLKSDLLDRSLRINLAAFHYDYSGIQLSVLQGPTTVTINSSSAVIDGAEFEVTWTPTSTLTLFGSGEVLEKAKYKNFKNAPFFVPSAAGNLQVSGDASGFRMLRTPKFTGSVGAQYRVPTRFGEVGTNVNYYYNSGFFWLQDNRLRQKAYGLLNASVSLTPTNGDWTFTAWAKNALDRAYFAYAVESVGSDGGAAAPPRTVGVSLERRF